MAAMEDLVAELERSYAEAQERMSDPAVFSDRNAAGDAGRRLKELEAPYKLAQEWRQITQDLEDAQGDPELAGMTDDLRAEAERLEDDLKVALVERDPNDAKDVLVEIRQGVGGDEAAIWAGDLYRLLTRYAERRGFKTEVLGSQPSEVGGYKEVTFAVKGDGAYSIFKWEGGTHRVQRVPETESQGRIHTSTATAAVMPEAEEVDIEIDQNDLKIDVYRSTGPGGQSVNTTDSAVRITHVPTGIVVAMQDEKSQLQNKTKAMRVLRARLLEAELRRQQEELDATRRSQIGSGERSEKIRTYNYPDSRVTDHRVKVTVNLEKVLGGDLEDFTEALIAEDRRRALEDRRGMSPLEAVRQVEARLAENGVPSPRVDAELLVAHVLGVSRTGIYANGRVVSPAEAEQLAVLVARRAGREPLAYVLGEWGFRRLTLQVDRRALVPRPETEVVVERCLELIAGVEAPAVLDVGTGSGAIALSIADEHPGARVCAVDSSAPALAVARENVLRTGLERRVELAESDLLAGVAGSFDLVVSNPPYISPR